jgi:hypothetical protein
LEFGAIFDAIGLPIAVRHASRPAAFAKYTRRDLSSRLPAAAEEVRVLGPNRTVQGERRGQDRPIIFVTVGDSAAREKLEALVGLGFDALHQPGQLIQECHRRSHRHFAAFEDCWERFTRFFERRIRATRRERETRAPRESKYSRQAPAWSALLHPPFAP